MNSIQLSAHAKINLRLEVIGKRDDGYHDLFMLMQKISLSDKVTIEKTSKQGVIEVLSDSGQIPSGIDNIAWKAASILFKDKGITEGIKININKKIPVAAGLGGGSSDAASVLSGLNELFELDISKEKLMKLGVQAGADVPFFLFANSAYAEGIGDILSTAEHTPQFSIILVNPQIAVSTAWVYKNLRLTERKSNSKKYSSLNTIENVAAYLYNDLESVTIPEYPVISDIKCKLLEAGAAGCLMSGSGSTVFGIFPDEDSAKKALDSVSFPKDWFTSVASLIR